MALKDLYNSPGSSSWYTPQWLNTIEDNLSNIMRINSIDVIRVDPIMHEHHKHNLYSFLREEVTEERRYWYVIMRCNNMTSPYQFDSGYDYIIYPRFNIVDDLHSAYLASIA